MSNIQKGCHPREGGAPENRGSKLDSRLRGNDTKNSARAIFYRDLIALFIGITLFYLIFLGSHGIVDPDEGRYSEAAREMLASGNFITPYVNGVPFLDKPILFYWLQMIAMKLFGVNAWSIRLFPMLSGVGSCVLVYIIGSQLYDRRVGILSALILAVMPLFFGIAHFANMDIEIAFFVTGAVGFGLVAIDKVQSSHPNPKYWMWLAFTFAALGVLTKGLIGIVFPMMILGVWIIFWNRWKVLTKLSLPIGILIFAVITLPWYIAVSRANPAFLHYFFIYEQFTRYTGDQFNGTQPIWYYPALIVGGILPWLWFAGQSIYAHALQVKRKLSGSHRSAILLLWPLLILIFFSVPASKLTGYIAPVFAPLALTLGTYLSNRWSSLRWRKAFYWILGVMVVLEVVLMGCMRFLPLNTVEPFVAPVKNQIQSSDVVVSYDGYFWGLPLYLQRQVLVVGNWTDVQQILTNDGWPQMFYFGMQWDPAAKKNFLNEQQFWMLWCSSQKVWAFAQPGALNNFAQHASCPYHLMVSAKRGMVVVNRS